MPKLSFHLSNRRQTMIISHHSRLFNLKTAFLAIELTPMARISIRG